MPSRDRTAPAEPESVDDRDPPAGPAIDEEARGMLEAHVQQMAEKGKVLYRCGLDNGTRSGTFFAPTLIEIDSIDVMELVILLEKDYQVFIDSKELGAEVLKSVRAMADFIEAKQGRA